MMRRTAPGHHVNSTEVMSRSLETLLLYGPRPRPPIGGRYHPNAVERKEAESRERLHRVRRLVTIRQAQKDVAAMERRLEATRESLTTMQEDVGVEATMALEQYKSPAPAVLPAFLERRRRELMADRAARAGVDTLNVVTVRTASTHQVSTTSITMTSRPFASSGSSSSASSRLAAADHLARRSRRAAIEPGRVKVRVLSASSSSGRSSGHSGSGGAPKKQRTRRPALLSMQQEASPLLLWDTREELSLNDKTLMPTTPEPLTPYYDSESTFPPDMTVLSPLDTLPQPLALRLPTRTRLAGCRSPASPR